MRVRIKRAEGTAAFTERTTNRKLCPTRAVRDDEGRTRCIATGPHVSCTYTSIAVTCSPRCPLKDNGCYAQAGITRRWIKPLDEAAVGHTSLEVVAQEAHKIDSAFGGGRIPLDGARGGRDLRLHVGGDVGDDMGGVVLLAMSAQRWRMRGGGSVWTFTHSWRSIPRVTWRSISVLASVERPEEI